MRLDPPERTRSTLLLSPLLLGGLILVSGPISLLYANLCANEYPDLETASTANVIKVVLESGDPYEGGSGTIDQNAADAATENWNDGCTGNLTPQLTADQEVEDFDWHVNVTFWPGKNDGAIGKPSDCTDPHTACGCAKTTFSTSGRLTAVQIHIFETQQNGLSCSGQYEDVLTHELGHALGLQDETSSGCDGRIMGNPAASIESDDCTEIESNWEIDTDFVDGPSDPDDGDSPCAV